MRHGGGGGEFSGHSHTLHTELFPGGEISRTRPSRYDLASLAVSRFPYSIVVCFIPEPELAVAEISAA